MAKKKAPGKDKSATPTGPCGCTCCGRAPFKQCCFRDQYSCAGARDWFRPIMAEFIGTALFVFVGTLAIVGGGGVGSRFGAGYIAAPLAFGFAAYALTATFARISGAHLNPAITVGAMSFGHINVWKGLFYILFQFLGGILGSLMLYACTGESGGRALGLGANVVTQVGQFSSDYGRQIAMELFLGTLLGLVYFSAAFDHPGTVNVRTNGPLAIGMTYAAAYLAEYNYSYGGINPARGLGPLAVDGYLDGLTFMGVTFNKSGIAQQEQYFVYLIFSPIGVVFAGLLWVLFFNDDEATAERLAWVKITQRESFRHDTDHTFDAKDQGTLHRRGGAGKGKKAGLSVDLEVGAAAQDYDDKDDDDDEDASGGGDDDDDEEDSD